jgi:hypothetical protein
MSRLLTKKFAHGCADKVRYTTKDEAEAALLALQGFTRKLSGLRRAPYACKFCGGFHNGRTEGRGAQYRRN